MRPESLRESASLHGRRGPSFSGEVRLCCPACEGGSRFTLSANAAAGAWYCHRCGAKGRGDLSWLGTVSGGGSSGDLPSSLGEPPPGFVSLQGVGAGSLSARPYLGYLEGRGALGAARAAEGGFCLDGRYAGRVVVPVLGIGGVWLGFSARSVYPRATPKYLYPPGMRRGRVLFNGLALGAETDDPVYVVEGVFDALWLWPDGVAVLGKPTSDQLALLAEARRPVVVALDGDAWQEGMVLALQLRALGARAVWLRLPPRTDPDQVSPALLREGARAALEEGSPCGSPGSSTITAATNLSSPSTA